MEMTSFFTQYFEKSIRISPDGFSFCKMENGKYHSIIFHNDSNALLTVEAANFFSSDDLIDVVLAENVPVLVPEEIFNSQMTIEYLKFQTDTSKIDKTIIDNFDNYIAISFISQDKANSLKKLPNKINIHIESSIFLKFLNDTNIANALFISQNQSYFDLLILQKKQLQLLNRFELDDTNDTIYYILNVIKQYGLKNPDVFIFDIDERGKPISDFLTSKMLSTKIFRL